MRALIFGSIRNNLSLLIMIAILPALAILVYTGVEQRNLSIANARNGALLITHTMAEVQVDIAKSAEQILSTLALLPEIKALETTISSDIFRSVLDKNPDYLNISLTATDGEVLASGLPFQGSNLKDRKHVQGALETRSFAAGEFIVSRVGSHSAAFAFAYPVLDELGSPKAVLTAAVNLERFSRFYETSLLPDQSFVAITDHRGIRLFYYPHNESTNPVGRPINLSNWQIAKEAREPGSFINKSSDGVARLFAFEPIRLADGQSPYLYVWAGIPNSEIVSAANSVLMRNLLLLLLVAVVSLTLSWLIAKRLLIKPINSLVKTTRDFSEGNLEARSFHRDPPEEIRVLENAFNVMANKLALGQRILKDNEARFRLLMDSLDALIYVVDVKTYKILFMNEYGKTQFGDKTGRLCWQGIQHRNGPCPSCTNAAASEPDSERNLLRTWEFKDDRTGKYYDVRDRVIKWVDGRIVRLEVATDITRRKLAEEKYRTLVEEANAGIALTDIESGEILECNQTLADMVERSRDELIGQKQTILHPGDARPPADLPDGSEQRGSDNEGLSTVRQCITSSGRIFEVETRTKTIDYTGRKVMMAIFYDISELLRLQKQLRQKYKMEAVGVMAGGIAHNFNNTLAAVLGSLELARRKIEQPEKLQEYIETAMKATLRSRDLVSQILTYSRHDGDRSGPTEVSLVFDETVKLFRSTRPATITLDVENRLDQKRVINGDPNQIQEALLNLCNNAVQAMGEKGAMLVRLDRVTLERTDIPAQYACRPGAFARITVKDSGCGMDKDTMDKIFDPFFTTKKIGEGTGMGLSTVQGIVKNHHGVINVSSTVGKGSTFELCFPMTNEAPAMKKKTDDEELPGGKERILFIDDDETLVRLGEEMLTDLNYRVAVATDSKQALNRFTDDPSAFDLVITDQTMPGLTGKEIIAAMKKIRPTIRTVLLTGYNSSKINAAEAARAGIDAFCMKPLNMSELAKTVRRALNGKRVS